MGCQEEYRQSMKLERLRAHQARSDALEVERSERALHKWHFFIVFG